MKYLIAIALFAVIIPVHGQEKRPQASPNRYAPAQPKQTAPQTPSTVNVINQQAPKEEQNGTKRHSEGYLSRLFAPENLPNIGLFLAAILGIGVAIRTLRAIENQTNAVLESVRAAERNTLATMQAERGRIVIFWGQVAHIDYGPTRIINGPLVHAFNWACGNAGRTQIEIIRTWSKLVAVEALTQLAEKPDYSESNERPYIGEPLQPNISGKQTPWFSAVLKTELPFQEVRDTHQSGKCRLYAYGFVEYRDVWECPHTYRFGVVRGIHGSITEDNWIPAGPPEYNRSE